MNFSVSLGEATCNLTILFVSSLVATKIASCLSKILKLGKEVP